MVRHNSESCLVVWVKSKQYLDPLLMGLKETVFDMFNESFSQGEYGVLRHQESLCILDVDDFTELIMENADVSRYSIHSGATKMYYDLREIY